MWKRRMAQNIDDETRLEYLLRPFNQKIGDVIPGWGTTAYMVLTIISFLVFLIILTEIYNSSLILPNIDIDWVTS